jgi:hypothetical protein
MPKKKQKNTQFKSFNNSQQTFTDQKRRNISFLQKLSLNQKYILISFVTLFLVLLLAFGGNWFNNRKFRNLLAGKKEIPETKNQDFQQALAKESLQKLKTELKKNNPEELLTQKISLKDLNIYPQAWVERNFPQSERQNPLIASAQGDPDGDGLSNQLEYFYASKPKNKFTLCASLVDKSDLKCKKTDKENVDAKISPLTGLEIKQEEFFDIKRIDKQVAESLSDSLAVASRQSLDFPEIYELSKNINIENEANSIIINSKPDNRDNLLEYAQKRLEVLEDFTDQNSLAGFSEIYEVIDVEGLNNLKNRYQRIQNNLNNMTVPQRFTKNHQATILTIKKSVELIDLRIEGISKSILEEKNFQESLKEKAKQMMAAYRILNEETEKTNQIDP